MRSLSYFSFRVLIIIGIACFLPKFSIAEETCSWMPDGSQVCSEDDESEGEHNVWTESLDEHHPDKEPEAKTSEILQNLASHELDEVELQLFVLFATQLKNWNPADGLAKFNPEVIIVSILSSFGVFDVNDDGFIEFVEMEEVLLKWKNEGNLQKIEDQFNEYPDSKISIFDCLKMFKKFNSGKETAPLLTPFERLEYMPPANAKKIIQGSVQMFIDSDQNNDGQLIRDEFFFGMERAQEKRKEQGGAGAAPDVTPDQLEALFVLMDKDLDDTLTFYEFQGTIPEKPKSFEESITGAFKDADINSDGKLSEDEFISYMKMRSKSENSKAIPSDKEASDAFAKLDTNDDDLLSLEEMMGMFDEVKREQEKRIIEAFRSFDKDADGYLAMDELEDIVKGIEQASRQKIDVKVFLTMLDQDMDKKVSLEEMQGILTQLVK